MRDAQAAAGVLETGGSSPTYRGSHTACPCVFPFLPHTESSSFQGLLSQKKISFLIGVFGEIAAVARL